jgi:hypothetical protein
MAEAFAPFIVKGTMHNLTFYVIEGRNFVRKKKQFDPQESSVCALL